MARPRTPAAERPRDEPETSGVECCPPLERDGTCDVIDFRYRTIHQRGDVPVEVTLIYRFERCPGPLTLGDLFYTSSVADFMSDLSVVDRQSTTNTAQGTTSGHFETSGAIQSFLFGPSVDVRGSFSGRTTSDFARELRQHARASDRRSMQAARAASSVSIGEVSTRAHAEGTSEDHFESSSREFANPNRCHALTFFFYRINKMQTVRWTLESIERRVVDQAADTKAVNNNFLARGGVSAIPDPILATRSDRLQLENLGRESFRLE